MLVCQNDFIVKFLSIKIPIPISVWPIYDQIVNVNIVHVWFSIWIRKNKPTCKISFSITFKKETHQKQVYKYRETILLSTK